MALESWLEHDGESDYGVNQPVLMSAPWNSIKIEAVALLSPVGTLSMHTLIPSSSQLKDCS